MELSSSSDRSSSSSSVPRRTLSRSVSMTRLHVPRSLHTSVHDSLKTPTSTQSSPIPLWRDDVGFTSASEKIDWVEYSKPIPELDDLSLPAGMTDITGWTGSESSWTAPAGDDVGPIIIINNHQLPTPKRSDSAVLVSLVLQTRIVLIWDIARASPRMPWLTLRGYRAPTLHAQNPSIKKTSSRAPADTSSSTNRSKRLISHSRLSAISSLANEAARFDPASCQSEDPGRNAGA